MGDISYQPSCVCQGDIDVYRNRDRTIRITIRTDIGDISGSLLWFSVKAHKDDLDSEALITKLSAGIPGGSDAQAKVVDGPNRIVEFYIDRADTEPLEDSDYWADAVIQLPSGNRVQLLAPSRFTVNQPITVTT